MQNNSPDFLQPNSLIYRKNISHKISSLSQPLKNIQLKFIILQKQPTFKTKKDTITQCLIADETASININFFGDIGLLIQQGDICYLSGGYTSYYKNMLILYQGQSLIRRIGKWYMKFNCKKNMTKQSSIKQIKGQNQQYQKLQNMQFKDD